jgi:RHS repeat-associated protein
LARIEIGNEKVQGVDYAYTIQGWLKGINSYTTGNGDVDMGKDGTEDGGLHAAGFPKDVTAELLNYYPNDYKKIGAEGAQFYPESPVAVLNSGFSKPLYNGNIQNSMMSVLHGFSEDTRKTFAQAYSYDQANRIRQSKMLFGNEAGFESAFSEQYKMNVDYDLNGNITKLSRTGIEGALFDDLTYKYNNPDNNNQLHYIIDAGASGATDLKNQTNTNNYSYDAIGRLTADISESISSIQYNNQSKVTAVNKSGSSAIYAYDAFGRRMSKTTTAGTEWYVNDALGNPTAIYNINGSEVRWKEATIYGGKRMGIYKPDVVLSSNSVMRDSTIRGNKSYELANHIGDVLAVVSDRKISTPDGFAAEVQAAHNYYPFGMVMPGRTFGNEEYRYGFQGMESEDNLRGENNSYTTEFRQYDPRVGRWMSVDPMAVKYPGWSPYNSFDCNPISLVDPKGAQSEVSDRDPAAEIAMLGYIFDAPGRLASQAVSAISNTLDRARMDMHSVATGDYSDRGRQAVLETRPVTDAAIFWYETLGGSIQVTADERVELDRNIGNGIVPTIVEQNLRRITLLITAHGVAENTATLLDGIANFDALSRAESSGRDPGSLFAARVRALDQIVSSTMGLAGAVGMDFGGIVEDVVGSGHFMQDVARTIYSSIYRLEDEDLRREMDSYRQLERGLCRSGVCR